MHLLALACSRLAALAFALAPYALAHAATTLVVPFAPGGGAAFVGTHLANALTLTLGQPVTPVHRPGGDGLAAVDEVAAAAADGSTLLLGSPASMMFAPMAVGRLPVDPLSDFALIGVVATVPRMIVIHPSLPARNLDELIRLARETPDAVPCGTADRVSQHAVRLFERQAGVQLDCAHYEGAGAMRDDLVAGKRKLAFESAYLPDVQRGALRAVAVAAPGRTRALADVPTASEAGLPGFEVTTWLALFAPKGTDAARVDELANALAATLRKPTFVSALEARGYVVRPMTLAQMRQFLERDGALWRRATPVRSDRPMGVELQPATLK